MPQLDETEFLDVEPLSYDREGDELTYEFDQGSFGGLDVEVDGSNLTLASRRGGRHFRSRKAERRSERTALAKEAWRE